MTKVIQQQTTLSRKKRLRPARRFCYRFDIVTIFPEMFTSVFDASILQRAQKAQKIEIRFLNPRAYTTDKHHAVDDTPYGGGPGMVMKVEPLVRALRSIAKRSKHRIIVCSAKGKRLTQQQVQQWAESTKQLIIVCGHYEGIDERIMDYADEEISIGDYVMTGGELAAMVIVDSVARLLPGVLGKDESSHEESHSISGELEYPQYTRPEIFDGKKVPSVLLSGHHANISAWRKKKMKKV